MLLGTDERLQYSLTSTKPPQKASPVPALTTCSTRPGQSIKTGSQRHTKNGFSRKDAMRNYELTHVLSVCGIQRSVLATEEMSANSASDLLPGLSMQHHQEFSTFSNPGPPPIAAYAFHQLSRPSSLLRMTTITILPKSVVAFRHRAANTMSAQPPIPWSYFRSCAVGYFWESFFLDPAPAHAP